MQLSYKIEYTYKIDLLFELFRNHTSAQRQNIIKCSSHREVSLKCIMHRLEEIILDPWITYKNQTW